MADRKPSQVKQFIIDTKLNGDNEVEAYRRIFGVDDDVSDAAVRGRINSMKHTDIYPDIESAVYGGFMGSLQDEAQKAAVNYLKKFNSMLEEGDRFIKDSDGEMKLKAFANQRELLKSNPFSVLNNLKETSEQPQIPEVIDNSDIIID